MKGLLFDAVSLRHFAVIDRLDILETRYERLEHPRWTNEVRDEIIRSSNRNNSECQLILKAKWLGEPIQPESSDHISIQRLRTALDPGGVSIGKHLGEAESIHFAYKHGYHFMTDDNDAYDFACKKLGSNHTLDVIEALTDAITMGELTIKEAVEAANSIWETKREFRRCHPTPITTVYLERLLG